MMNEGVATAISGLLKVAVARIERAEFSEAVRILTELIEDLGGEVIE